MEFCFFNLIAFLRLINAGCRLFIVNIFDLLLAYRETNK